jgi:hypothetical protein
MITSKVHGVLDYVTVLVFALSPSLFALSETGTTIAYSLAVIHLLMTILTAFSMGLIKIIPFQIHGYVELIVGLVLAIAPWLVDFLTHTDQWYFSIMGGVILLVWLLTTYKSPLKE